MGFKVTFFIQHDCQEFLALLLDGLHEELNSSGPRNQLSQLPHFAHNPTTSSENGTNAPPSSPVFGESCEQEKTNSLSIEDYLKDTKILNTNVQVNGMKVMV